MFAHTLVLIWSTFFYEKGLLQQQHAEGKWWVSGKTPDGREQHYVIRGDRAQYSQS
eukprot:m.398502 g.398502  ORF g.398502 m.398502 type:complete len:56 (+) comp21136_c0_seq17:181-348(+)